MKVSRITLGFFFYLAMTTVLLAAEANAVNWNTDYAAAHQERLAEQRPMLVFVSMDGCHFCEQMLRLTYANTGVADQIATNYVPTYINGSKHRELAKQFRVRVFPTTFLIGPDNRVLDRIEGYMAADAFRERISLAAKTIARAKAATQPAAR